MKLESFKPDTTIDEVDSDESRESVNQSKMLIPDDSDCDSEESWAGQKPKELSRYKSFRSTQTAKDALDLSAFDDDMSEMSFNSGSTLEKGARESKSRRKRQSKGSK